MFSNLISILAKLTAQPLILPFYHSVSNTIPLHLKHLYAIKDARQFEHDIQFLIKEYRPIPITGLSKVRNQELQFCLTFDDGLREFKEVAWPIIQKYDVPVTLFVNSAFVDNKAMFFRFKSSLLIEAMLHNDKLNFTTVTSIAGQPIQSKAALQSFLLSASYHQRHLLDQLAEILEVDFKAYLQKNKPYLSLAELKELEQQGVIIGAHSVDHPLFNQLSLNDQLAQIKESLNWVADNFQNSIKSFSFPFTDFGLGARLFECMYEQQMALVDFSFGTAGIKNETINRHFQRIPIEDYKGSAKMALIHQYLYYLAKAPLKRNTICR